MALFSPANSGTSPMSGIYASLRQAQIIILEILQYIPVGIIFAFLDLGKNISFSDSLPVIEKVCFDIHLFNGKTKKKENLSVNIEQIGVFVQGRTEERRKNSPSGKTTHGAMFFCERPEVLVKNAGFAT